MTFPRLLTIVTITFNNADGLEATIKSVIRQHFKNYEYIVIDGASNDRTFDVLSAYKQYFSKWVSEPDKGIYDAMNKGLRLANGEWILFLNAGDTLFNEEVLQVIFSDPYCYGEVDVVFGDVVVQYEGFEKIRRTSSLEDLRWKMPFCHQACLIRTGKIKNRPFNTNYLLSADFDMIVNLYESGCKFLNINTIISRITSGGTSDTTRIKAMVEWKQILQLPPLTKYWFFLHMYLVRTFFSGMVKKIFPRSFVYWITKRI